MAYDTQKLTKVGDLKAAVEGVKKVIPTKTSALNNDSGYQTGAQVDSKISAALSSVYKPQGSSTFAGLPTPTAGILGHVYNVTDAFTATAVFLEGAGKTYPAGTNVVVVESGESYVWDVLAGFVDLSGYVEQVSGKSLSTEDYTTAEKLKLAGIEVATDEEVQEMLAEVFGFSS